MSPQEHREFIRLTEHIYAALVAEMARRNGVGLDWIDAERFVVAEAANGWAQAHGIDRLVTVDDVERIEVRAVGHVDYARKLALYVAEYLLGLDVAS